MILLSDCVTRMSLKVESFPLTQKELTATRISYRLPVSPHSENIQRISESSSKDSWEPHAALRASVENHRVALCDCDAIICQIILFVDSFQYYQLTVNNVDCAIHRKSIFNGKGKSKS